MNKERKKIMMKPGKAVRLCVDQLHWRFATPRERIHNQVDDLFTAGIWVSLDRLADGVIQDLDRTHEELE